jgi:thiol-disulfide isomerase/thioredoxin
MKRILTSLIIVVVLGLFTPLVAQQAPYLAKPFVPDFYILGTDSSTIFNKSTIKKGKPVMIILFSPDCEHCQKQTASITKNIKAFEGVEVVMATYQPVFKAKAFASQYKLGTYPNFYVGRDVMYFFGPFYQLKSAPFIAIYNKEQKLIKAFDGGAPVEKLLETLKM